MSKNGMARAFLDACETGKGWDICQKWCHPDATFTCQEGAADSAITLQEYANWMTEILTPDGGELFIFKSFAMYYKETMVVTVAQFYGIQSGGFGPVPLTSSSVVTDYTYVIEFEDDKICHMTKLWSDAHATRDLEVSKKNAVGLRSVK